MSELEEARSIIERLIQHLDEAHPQKGKVRADLSDPSTERTVEFKDWLHLVCFGQDHTLYDDIMAFMSTTGENTLLP